VYDTSNFNSSVLQNHSDRLLITICIDDETLYEPPTHLMDTTILALEIDFKVSNKRELYCLLAIHITFNCKAIKLAEEPFIYNIFKRNQIQDCDLMLLPIDPNIQLTKDESVLVAEKHYLYQSINKSIKYLVMYSRPELAYPISYLSQFLDASSEPYLIAAP
jgi:hypothetical protein